ncbi:MAG: alpha-aminoadipate/glutamate carrier protein LysW/ArgW [Thermoprotei archaeon]|jgi:alpha-aminoadipate carrier protein LysW
MAIKVMCQVCGGTITIPDDAIVGEIVSCPDCGIDYEVSQINNGSIQLKIAEDIGEDWGE